MVFVRSDWLAVGYSIPIMAHCTTHILDTLADTWWREACARCIARSSIKVPDNLFIEKFEDWLELSVLPLNFIKLQSNRSPNV